MARDTEFLVGSSAQTKNSAKQEEKPALKTAAPGSEESVSKGGHIWPDDMFRCS